MNKKVILPLVLAVCLVITGASVYVYQSNSKAAIVGDDVSKSNVNANVGYDWKSGEVKNNYQTVDPIPTGWEYVAFVVPGSKDTNKTFGFWTATSSPQISSRDISLNDTGDDVEALQVALNNIAIDDTSSPYYYPQLKVTGTYDTATIAAVNKLQPFFNLEVGPTADLDFQSNVYYLLLTPPGIS